MLGCLLVTEVHVTTAHDSKLMSEDLQDRQEKVRSGTYLGAFASSLLR